MTTQITELAIISVAFGTVLGYLIGIIKHLADHNWRMDSMDLI